LAGIFRGEGERLPNPGTHPNHPPEGLGEEAGAWRLGRVEGDSCWLAVELAEAATDDDTGFEVFRLAKVSYRTISSSVSRPSREENLASKTSFFSPEAMPAPPWVPAETR